MNEGWRFLKADAEGAELPGFVDAAWRVRSQHGQAGRIRITASSAGLVTARTDVISK